MPQTPYAALRASVNGGAPQTGGLTLVADDVVQLSPASTAGWNTATTQYQITAFPPGWAGPAGWSYNAGQGLFYYYANGVNGTSPPPVTLPSSVEIAAGLWGKWKFRLLVNGGGGPLTDDSLAVRILSQSGLDDVARREGGEFDAVLRWVAALQNNFRIVDAAIAGGLGGGASLGAGTPAVVNAGAGTAGALLTAAPFDHRHQVLTGTPVSVGAANAAGSGTALAFANHVHNHGAQTDPGHHALASGSAHGFFSSTGFTKLAGIEAGAQVTSFAHVQTALGLASSDIAVNSVKITGLANGTSPQDAVTVAQLQAASFGFDLKQEARGASVSNVSLVGALTHDGIVYADDDRFLAKNQTAPEENGLWVVNTAGAWTRAADADSSTEVTPGLFVFVLEGTQNANTGWALFDAGPFTVDVDPLNFTQVFGPGTIIAGAGLTQSGNTINVVANADGSIVVAANDIKVGILATDAQHGNRGNGALHTVADATHDGFMPQGMWSTVNGATSNATANKLALRGALGACSFGPLDATTLDTSGLASLDSLEVSNASLFDGQAQFDGLIVSTAGITDGSSPVATGAFINLSATSTTVSYRNAANSANIVGLGLDGADNLVVGTNALTIQLAAPIEHRHNALGATEVAGLNLINATAASSGNQQYSPAIIWEGRGWTTNGGGSSNVSRWWAQVRPVQSSGAAVQTRLVFSYATGTGAPTDMVRLDSVVGIYVASTVGVGTAAIDADSTELKIGTNTVSGLTTTTVVVGAAVTPVKFTGQRYSDYFALTYAATTTIDWANGDHQKITLTGNVAFAAPSNVKDGATYTLVVVQDGAGAHTATWNGVFKFTGGGGDQTLSAGAGAVDIFVFEAFGTTLLCTVARKALA